MTRSTMMGLVLLMMACGDDPVAVDDTGPSFDASIDAERDAEEENDSGGADSGSTDSGGDTAPDAVVPPEGVAVIMGQGHMGRTLVSCDDGHTWVGDQNDDSSVRCFSASEPSFDCDHHPSAGRGLVFDGDVWLATFGWGSPPGEVRRSTDGTTWETVLSETTLAGLAAGQGAVVGAEGGRSARRTTDGGTTWSTVETTLVPFNARTTHWVPIGEGLFVITGQSGDERGITLSDDGGASWRASDYTGECLAQVRTVGALGGSLIVIGGQGRACVSSDRGATFVEAVVAENLESAVISGGEAFAFTSDPEDGYRPVVYRSTDGMSWSKTAITPNERPLRTLGTVTATADGSFVAAGGWQSWYEDQNFFRSDDGVAWEILDSSAFEGGHPMREFVAGRLPACP